MKKKSGISLLVLVLTIIVIIIIMSVSIISIGDVADNAKIASLADDMLSIKDQVLLYYANNDNYPINQDAKISLDDYTQKVYAKYNTSQKLRSSFDTEVAYNGDTEFYEIELDKLDITQAKRGNKEDSDMDCYLLALPSTNVYYMEGIKAKRKVYFSLNYIAGNTNVKLNEEQTNSATTTKIQEVEGVRVTKTNGAYSNSLGIVINTKLEAGESLYLLSQENYTSSSNLLDLSDVTSTGNNILVMNDFASITNLSNSKTKNTGFVFDEKKQKTMTVIKKKSGSVVASIPVNIDNYDNIAPTVVTGGANVKYDVTKNVVTLKVQDSLSGVKAVRYDYLTKYDEKGNSVDYYQNKTSLEKDYLISNGKRAVVSDDGYAEIELEKNISKIALIVVDKAGNASSVYTKDLYNSSDVFATANLVESTSTYVSFDLYFNSQSTLSTATAQIGDSLSNFTTQKTITLTPQGNKRYTGQVKFEQITSDKIYLKLVANNSVSILEFDKPYDTSMLATANFVIKANNSTITIPKGFAPVTLKKDGTVDAILPVQNWNNTYFTDEKINSGVVVIDEKGNEYVWVPCTLDGANSTIKYEKLNGTNTTSPYCSKYSTIDDTLPSGVTDETTQISKYGGFYVARYEASLPDSEATEDLLKTKTFSIQTNNNVSVGIPQSKYDKIPWNYVDYPVAKSVSEKVQSNDYVQSCLITGRMWDTMCAFISKTGVDVYSYSASWGNMYTSLYNVTGYYTTDSGASVKYRYGNYNKIVPGMVLLTTGKYSKLNPLESPKNICDVAGNMWELNSEVLSNQNAVLRACGCNLSSFPALFRHSAWTKQNNESYVGFRFALFIK